MKVLILNSGSGKRMGVLTTEHPKCLTPISEKETILSRQLRIISAAGINEVIITTGLFEQVLIDYCESLELSLNIKYVKNVIYEKTNYIYSMYCARELLEDEDIILMHGDLVFEESIFDMLISSPDSCMIVSSTATLPEKDFKAVVNKDKITKIGIEFFQNAVAAQPLYLLKKNEWKQWMTHICNYVQAGKMTCYAENAFNEISDKCSLRILDVKEAVCCEIDTPEELREVSEKVRDIMIKTVYMCFSTDIIHSAHIAIIRKAEKLGRLIIGVLSDEAVASYKRYPLMPFEERKTLFENINGVYKVIEQKQLSYVQVLNEIKPDFVVHGDDWKSGFQRPIRDEVVTILSQYGGKLVEYVYSNDAIYEDLDKQPRALLAMPDMRRGRLKKLISMKGCINAIEVHSGITGLIAEKTTVLQEGRTYQFDAMWLSSLCDSTAKGKPDIELVDMTSRFRTIDDIMEVTTKPIIFDGDTGGLTEHFVYTVKSLERMGVSMVIIEDKTGLKKNSLFGNEVRQIQDSIENFCAKISAGKKAQKTNEFMIVARIESLILEAGMEDALKRAFAYVEAGADGIMVHSRRKEPDEVFEFCERFRSMDQTTPIVLVPTTFNAVTEEEFKNRGINVIIYANHLTRSGFPAMKKVAASILENHRAKEAEDLCMSINEIITLIPEE